MIYEFEVKSTVVASEWEQVGFRREVRKIQRKDENHILIPRGQSGMLNDGLSYILVYLYISRHSSQLVITTNLSYSS